MNAETTEQYKKPNFYLSPREIAEFNERGFLGPFDLMTPEEMKEHWKRVRLSLFDRTNVVYPDAAPGTGVYDYDRHLDNDFLASLISRPEIVHRAISLYGPNLLVWRTEFFPKYPHDEGTDWHQADTFGGGDGIPHLRWPNPEDIGGTFSAWIAFTDASEDMACLQFIPGTQRTMNYDESKGMHYDPSRVKIVDGIQRGFFGYHWTDIQKDPNWKPDESKAVSVPCKAGQFILFPSTLMHASLPHRGKTNQTRMSWTIRYVPTCVTVYESMKESNIVKELGGSFRLDRYGTVLVAGEDTYKHNRVLTHTLTNRPFVKCES